MVRLSFSEDKRAWSQHEPTRLPVVQSVCDGYTATLAQPRDRVVSPLADRRDS
jgi:hypothetical protein